MNCQNVKWITVIVDRGRGGAAASVFGRLGLNPLLIVRARGTASSALMDCLGLDEPEKDLVIGLAGESQAGELLGALGDSLGFSRPGRGIAFTAPFTGISLAMSRLLAPPKAGNTPDSPLPSQPSKEELPMSEPIRYELIAAVIAADLTGAVMDAAKRTGCRGGTLIKAREAGAATAKKLFGMTVAREAEILLILVPACHRLPVLSAICDTVFRETGEHAMACSIPVDAVAGLAAPDAAKKP